MPLLALAACGIALFSTDHSNAEKADASGARSDSSEASSCAALVGSTLGDGVSVTAAAIIPAGSLQTSARTRSDDLPSFCRVQGVSKPSADSNISFEVWLPRAANWNQKFLSTGEGGFAGRINYGTVGTDGALDENLRRGFATASTDTGHDQSDVHFAIGHPERGTDYLTRAKHVTTVAAKSIIRKFYGRPPVRSYFSSCSNGGREGLVEAQLYPEDFDGLIIGAPWNRQSRSLISHLWMRQFLSEPGAAIPAAKLPLIHGAVLKACDGTDGLMDGVINDPGSCRFDPDPLRCRGADASTCLTTAQVASLRRIYEGPRDPRDGSRIFAPYVPGQETDTFGRPDDVSGFPEQYVANFVTGDPQWDARTFNLKTDMPRMLRAGRAGDADATDFAAAKARGVKIIQYHGWSDLRIQPGNSIDYYRQVAARNGGLAKTADFYRLFMVPGMGHCSGGVGASNFGGVGQRRPPARDRPHDLVTALEAWVEKGESPDEFIATSYATPDPGTGVVKLQRRLCRFPAVARYRGVGNTDDPASFECRT